MEVDIDAEHAGRSAKADESNPVHLEKSWLDALRRVIARWDDPGIPTADRSLAPSERPTP